MQVELTCKKRKARIACVQQLQVGNYIQYKGGVVTAEELAPYLDVPPAGKDADSIVIDESYIVPALVRFGGSPDVDRNNNLVYKFPSLQKTGRPQVRSTPGVD